jgi:hypothetical protein
MDENLNLIQTFGFSEMYEWADPSKSKLGIFVTFDKEIPNRILPFGENNNTDVLGVSTINSVIESDNPKHWKFSYMCNEVGDIYLKKEKLAVGQKIYDQVLELNYIQTRPWEHLIPIENKYLDKNLKYIPRTNRQEWVRVNILGKVVVRDNGECKPGEYCQPYNGKLIEDFGIAVPASEDNPLKKFYVLERLSEKTILILNK